MPTATPKALSAPGSERVIADLRARAARTSTERHTSTVAGTVAGGEFEASASSAGIAAVQQAGLTR